MGKQRGTQVYSVRLEESLIESVGKWLAKRGRHPTLEPMTFTDFIRVAIREKLDKDARNKESYERGMRAKRKEDSAWAESEKLLQRNESLRPENVAEQDPE